MSMQFNKRTAQINARYDEGNIQYALELSSSLIEDIREAQVLMTPRGLECLILHARLMFESGEHNHNKAQEVMRECAQCTKRDQVVKGDTPEDAFARLDTLFQLLMFSQQPELAMGVAKERVYLQRKHPDGTGEDIGRMLYDLAKEESAAKAQQTGKKQGKKKAKQKKKAVAAGESLKSGLKVVPTPKREVLDENITLEALMKQLHIAHCYELLEEYGVEEVEELQNLEDDDFEGAGIDDDEKAKIRAYLDSGRQERISDDVIVFPYVLGSGATSTCVEGFSSRYQDVAVKMCSANLRGEAEEAYATYQKFRVSSHPNLVAVYDLIPKSFNVFIVLQRCYLSLLTLFVEEGEVTQLQHRVMQKVRGRELQLVKQLVSGVGFLHSTFGKTNAELKPRNILFDAEGHVKINDFFVHKPVGAERTLTSFTSLMEGGNMGWRAPEIVANHGRSGASDVFTVGLMCFYILTRGKHAFGGHGISKATDLVRENRVGNGTPPNLSPLKDSLSRLLVAKCLAYKREDRCTIQEAIMHPLFYNLSEVNGYFNRIFTLHSVKMRAINDGWMPQAAPLLKIIDAQGKWVNHVSDHLRFYLKLCSVVQSDPSKAQQVRSFLLSLKRTVSGKKPSTQDVTNYFLDTWPDFFASCVARFSLGTDEEEYIERQKAEEAKKAVEERMRAEKEAERKRREVEAEAARVRSQKEAEREAKLQRKEEKRMRREADRKARLENLKRGDEGPRIQAEKEKSKPLCSNFLKTGRCRFGDRCRFRHELPKEKKTKSKKSNKDEDLLLSTSAPPAPLTKPLAEVLKELKLSHLFEALEDYGIETCADVQEMEDSDFQECGFSTEERQMLRENTVSRATNVAPDLKYAMKMLGLSQALYRKLEDFGVDTVMDVKHLSDSDMQDLELTPAEAQQLSTGFFAKDGEVLSDDLVIFQNKVLGTGSTGTVKEGLSISRGRVAIKVAGLQHKRAILAEVRALKELGDHPNIITFYGVHVGTFNLNVVLALCVMNLRHVFMDDAQLAVPQRKVKALCRGHGQEERLCAEIVAGVAFLHNIKGFNHRDLKPENLLLNAYATIKISDLGIAKQNKGDDEGTQTDTLTATDTQTQTATGTATATDTATAKTATLASIGTRCWRAPEVVHSTAQRTAKADCFSVGLILWYVLSGGKHPYQVSRNETAADLEAKITNPKAKPGRLPNTMTGAHMTEYLLQYKPDMRLTMRECRIHPFFMTLGDRFTFLKRSWDEAQDKIRAGGNVFVPWMSKVPHAVVTSAMRESKLNSAYKDTRYDQLRFVRNLYEHGNKASGSLSREIGKLMRLTAPPTRLDVASFVEKCFPDLVLNTYMLVVSQFEGREEPTVLCAEGYKKIEQIAEQNRIVVEQGVNLGQDVQMQQQQQQQQQQEMLRQQQQQKQRAQQPQQPPPQQQSFFQPSRSGAPASSGFVTEQVPLGVDPLHPPSASARNFPPFASQPGQYYAGQTPFAPAPGYTQAYVPTPNTYPAGFAPTQAQQQPSPFAATPATAAPPSGPPCTTCGENLTPGMRFCGVCGSGKGCDKCGKQNPLNFKYCGHCATRLE